MMMDMQSRRSEMPGRKAEISMSNFKEFLKRKDIVITPQRYLIEALGAMAQGLFASLLIGTIIKTLGQQTGLAVLVDLGGYATAMSGPAMACAIGWALHCPPLVLFSLRNNCIQRFKIWFFSRKKRFSLAVLTGVWYDDGHAVRLHK